MSAWRRRRREWLTAAVPDRAVADDAMDRVAATNTHREIWRPLDLRAHRGRDRPVSLTCRVLADHGRIWTVVAHARHQVGDARTAFGVLTAVAYGRLVDDDAGGFRR